MPNTAIRVIDLPHLLTNHGSVLTACRAYLGLGDVTSRQIADSEYGKPGRPRGLTAYHAGHGRRSRPEAWQQLKITDEELGLLVAIQEAIWASHKRRPSLPVVLRIISRDTQPQVDILWHKQAGKAVRPSVDEMLAAADCKMYEEGYVLCLA